MSANLTPMTRDANAAYLRQVEVPLKTALDKARSHAVYVAHGHPDYYYGVEFSAQPFGQKFPTGSPAQQAVANYIEVIATWLRKPRDGGETQYLNHEQAARYLAGGDPAGVPVLPNGYFDPVNGNFGHFDPVTGAFGRYDPVTGAFVPFP
jgi:hypothetical protein